MSYQLPFKKNLQEVQLAINAAIEAGKTVMKIYQHNFSTKLKKDGKIELFSSWQQYRAFIKEKVIDISGLEAGIAYDYYKGLISGARLSINGIKRLIDSNINPSSGFKLDASAVYEKNDFIEGLNLSESGTLLEKFKENNWTYIFVAIITSVIIYLKTIHKKIYIIYIMMFYMTNQNTIIIII